MRPGVSRRPKGLSEDPPSSLGLRDHRSIAYSTLGLSYADSRIEVLGLLLFPKVLPPRTLRNYRV